MKDQIKRGKAKPLPKWQKTSFANLYRNTASGIFYAVFKLGGKQVWRSLESDKITVAKLKLPDVLKSERAKLSRGDGKLTLQQALNEHLERVRLDPTKKERTVDYHRQRIHALRKTWPTPLDVQLAKVTPDDCRRWASAHSKFSATNFNKTLGILRSAFDIGFETGALTDSPAKGVARMKETPKPLQLPEPDAFNRFVKEIQSAGGRDSVHCANFVRFLAFGGFRLSEANAILGSDVEPKRIKVVGGKGREGREFRHVPIIPDMQILLDSLDIKQTQPVMKVRECQKSMDRAAKIVGIERITHHDLRHLFATRCIEAGVDVPTVSRWLGHRDGGALAMRVYGHLRDEHSDQMAAKVTFDA